MLLVNGEKLRYGDFVKSKITGKVYVYILETKVKGRTRVLCHTPNDKDDEYLFPLDIMEPVHKPLKDDQDSLKGTINERALK